MLKEGFLQDSEAIGELDVLVGVQRLLKLRDVFLLNELTSKEFLKESLELVGLMEFILDQSCQ